MFAVKHFEIAITKETIEHKNRDVPLHKNHQAVSASGSFYKTVLFDSM